MNSYSTRIFPADLVHLRDVVERFVADLPDTAGHGLRCHEVARVVTRVFDVGAVVDGVYGPVDHSWIVFEGRPYILDPYAVGRLPQVQMLTVELGLATLYQERAQRDDIDTSLVADLAARHEQMFWVIGAREKIAHGWRGPRARR